VLTAINANFPLLEQALAQFDARFTLRVLRSISAIRKSPHFLEALTQTISTTYSLQTDSESKALLLNAIGQVATANGAAKSKSGRAEELTEETFAYLAILVQVCMLEITDIPVSNILRRSIYLITKNTPTAQSSP